MRSVFCRAQLVIVTGDAAGTATTRRDSTQMPAADVQRPIIPDGISADTAAMRRFIGDHFVIVPGAAPVDMRPARFADLRERLGALRLELTERFDDGPVEVTVNAAGAAVLSVHVDHETPYRTHALQGQVGGA